MLINSPLVSVIVPTFNSSCTLEACLSSISKQSYPNIELIVVDNNSCDNTKEIARRYTEKVFNYGPERSAQRNYGVTKCSGIYVIIIDSDMELTINVVRSCIDEIGKDPTLQGIVIPEESFGEGWWARCKWLERSFYVGVEWMEAARLFRKFAYEQVGGYNEKMVSGEDWDLSQRISRLGKMGRISDYIFHNEGTISLLKTMRKKFYYSQKFASYVSFNQSEKNLKRQTGIAGRYLLFFSNPRKLFGNPFLGLSMLFMKTCEFGVGGVGYFVGKFAGSDE